MDDEEKMELIHKLKDNGIIDEYGNIDTIELAETYGQAEARNILKEITFHDLYKTYTIEECYNIGKAILQDLQIGFLKHRVYTEDTNELLAITEVIKEKEKR